jgi:hypothetical protein
MTNSATTESKPEDHQTARSRRTAILVAMSVILILGGGYAWYRYYATPPLSRYDQVLAALRDHQIPPDESGRLDLSKQFPGITGHNDAYITYRPDNTFIVMFPTYYGLGQEVAGLLYTSRKLTEDDTHGRNSAINFEQRLVKAGSYDHLLLENRINDNWYHVSYKIR